MGVSSDVCFDRRRFPRYPCTGEAEILQGGKPWGWGTVSDISRGGCYIETNHPLPTGAEAQLRLTIAGIFLDLCANVVSSDPMFGMGMDFVVVPIEEWNKLPEIIEKVSEADTSFDLQQNTRRHDGAQHHMQAALQHLEKAQKELQEVKQSTGGYRALQLTENAIKDVRGSGTGRDHPALKTSCVVDVGDSAATELPVSSARFDVTIDNGADDQGRAERADETSGV